jgi:hypothetical protein
MQPPLPPSIVNDEAVTAFNLHTRLRSRPMHVTNIIRYVPTVADRNARYQLQGVDIETNDEMSKFCNETYAFSASDQLNIPIENFGAS